MVDNFSKSSFINRNSSLIDICLISLIWIFSAIFVNPIGEFPINDDWSFALTTKKFYETGTFQPLGWAAMPQITNTVWGSIFLLPKGFSFSALRISTLTISLIGVWAVYLTAVRIGCSRLTSFAVAITFAFSPLYYPLSLTFMTDALFVALVAISCYFFVQNLFDFSWSSYFLALIVVLGATLSRQLALAVTIGFALAFIFRYGSSLRTVILALVPFLACVSSYLMLRHWLSLNGKLPELFDSSNANFFMTLSNPLFALRLLPNNFYVALMYFGLILSPVMVHEIFLEKKSREYIKTFAGIFFLFLLFGVLRSLFHDFSFFIPITGNTFNATGLGPFLINDYESKAVSLPSLPVGIRALLTGVALICAVEILMHAFSLAKFFAKKLVAQKSARVLMSPTESVIAFALITSATCTLPILLVGFYDRYLLSVLPPLIIVIFSTGRFSLNHFRKKVVTLSVATLAAAFSVAGTHDMLSWNRARWEGVDYLKKELGAKDREIDGGFEFNGFCCYRLDYQGVDGKSWWWVEDDLYRIGFGIPDGYTLLKEFHYQRLLPPGHGSILVSKRASGE